MKIGTLFLILINSLFLLLLNSCANIPLKEDAVSVKVYFSLAEKTNCDYVGDVIGTDGNFMTFWFMSNEHLTQGALHDIRNEAHAMGGDTVFILREMLQYTTSTTFVGSVYRCNKKYKVTR